MTFSPPPSLRTEVIDVHASASSSRSTFVDLARAGAVLMMLQGHTLDVVLATELRTGIAFDAWSFLRGLTSCTFLVLSGFVFTLQARRLRSADASPSIRRRVRRYGALLIAGYALHFPAGRFVELAGLSDERWRSALVVDVLQCIAVTLLCLQAVAMVWRTPRRYGLCVSVGCATVVALTPAAWHIDWSSRLPGALAAYLSPATGSPFPIFPWSAFMWFGAWLGWLHLQSETAHASFANRVLLGGGAAMLAGAYICAQVPLGPFRPTDFWSTTPLFFLLRGGLVMLILAALAQVSRFVKEPSPVIRAVARESFTIYVVHLCLVYGSAWNIGLRHVIGPTQTLLPALAWVAIVWTSMTLLAVGWHDCKHRTPRFARWLRIGAAALLLGRLL